MPDSEIDSVAVVFAPHPDLFLVMCSCRSGGFGMYHMPIIFDEQDRVDAWFDARREPVAC